MKGKESYHWDQERLRRLVETTRGTYTDLAEKIGISRAALNQYLNRNTTPELPALIKLADYFQVPVDYFLGRTDDTSWKAVYPERWKTIHADAYDKYMIAHKERSGDTVIVPEGYRAPWPYNLLDEVLEIKTMDACPDIYPLSARQKKRFEQMLSTLPKPIEECMREYFEHHKSLNAIANECGLSKEGVRKRLQRGMQLLRHPAVLRMLFECPA